MIENRVCAVIVTFRPSSDVLQNLTKVRSEVDGLVVVDNGSSAEELAPFRLSTEGLHFELIENRKNLGIAAALNKGVRWAQSQGYKFVALFDQDSTAPEGFIEAMLLDYKSHPRPDEVAIVTPVHLNRKTGESRTPFYGKDGNPLDPLTSGSLIPTAVFDRTGLFEEDLIIDYVDVEYALRAYALGFTTLLARKAILWHVAGSPRQHRIFGLKSIKTTHHSAARRYYMTRNRLVMTFRYGKQHPRWCITVLDALFRETLKVALVEEDRMQKLLNIARGVFDAFRSRMGKVVEL